MYVYELWSALGAVERGDAPVLATTPHGTYLFNVVAVEGTPDAPVLRLVEVEA